MRYAFFALLLSLSQLQAQPRLLSPDEFLGYPLGSRYTRHHELVDYFRHVAIARPDLVLLKEYGRTNEGRPLLQAFLSSPQHIRDLELIRKDNLRAAGLLRDGKPAADRPVIVWLSYNVHGNEPSSSEAAMRTIHRLLDGSDPRAADWLSKAVVVIDPCINPDGRDRYVNWQNGVSGTRPDADPQTREHREPWPGGRVNHYYFDLNRDWAWQSQVETRQRMKVYQDWMPQVHVDFHEQSPSSPYYFAPAAEPYHEVITPWQREFQRMIGRNNASYFDREGWLFFTRERFDLLYPSYGDTYPIYNGAIGMTYEQGGGPRGGRAVALPDGDTLTLLDRLSHHVATGLSTIETSVRESARLRQEYRKFFQDALAEPATGATRHYLIRRKGASKGLTESLLTLLQRNGIQYGRAVAAGSGRGFRYASGREEAFEFEAGDIVIPVQQPRGTLLKVLMEPQAKLSDSATYDITAWALPYAMGLDAFAVRDKPAPQWTDVDARPPAGGFQPIDDATAYAIPWADMGSVSLLSRLLQSGLRVRFAQAPFRVEGRAFARGTLLVTRAGNRLSGRELGERIAAALRQVKDFPHEVVPIRTALVEEGHDLGSGDIRPLKASRIALLGGEGVIANGFGEIWHWLDREVGYPVSVIQVQDLATVRLEAFDVIILPDGNYRMFSDKSVTDPLRDWVRKGGRLVALENAAAQLAGLDWGLKLKRDESSRGRGEADSLRRYADRERDALRNSIPGTIYRVTLDETHPLAFGYPRQYFTLRQDASLYEPFREGGWNVGTLGRDAHVSGFAGVRVRERMRDGVLIGALPMGAGQIVFFADDPVFRGFWENGKLMLANALFLVGQ
jgi:hypothetical protein